MIVTFISSFLLRYTWVYIVKREYTISLWESEGMRPRPSYRTWHWGPVGIPPGASNYHLNYKARIYRKRFFTSKTARPIEPIQLPPHTVFYTQMRHHKFFIKKITSSLSPASVIRVSHTLANKNHINRVYALFPTREPHLVTRVYIMHTKYPRRAFRGRKSPRWWRRV